NRRITATPLEIRPKLKNRHGIQRTLTNNRINVNNLPIKNAESPWIEWAFYYLQHHLSSTLSLHIFL
ncbi:hypothetical protein, partial [Acinetobacter johnsonii]|uniref:hypothetical protein n=1 Tax=Acinetobacter johnsonii TaxID=40214 RepID=UPI001F1ED7FD